MLNFIRNKLSAIYAVYATALFCKMCETSRKTHIDYHVRGVAKISAIDKLELDRTNDEVFYMDDLTAKVSHRFNSGYYKTHRILLDCTGTVDMESFRAVRVHADGTETVLTREEYLASRPYRQDQARIVYPDGRVITDADFVQRVISRQSLVHFVEEIKSQDYANDESFALQV